MIMMMMMMMMSSVLTKLYDVVVRQSKHVVERRDGRDGGVADQVQGGGPVHD